MNSLSCYFEGIVAKRLSEVEVDAEASHQHEFNAPSELIEILGKQKFGSKKRFQTVFLYLSDGEENAERAEDVLTFYEARQKPRTEHRIYYRQSPVIEKFREGDLLIFGKKRDRTLMVIVAAKGSSAEKQLLWLFSLSSESLKKTEYKDLKNQTGELDFSEKLILEELGIETIPSDNSGLEEILKKFDGVFPATALFSSFARDKTGAKKSADPDSLLIAWITKEEELFRALERHIVGKRLREGFGPRGDDVDAFVKFSLSVHNRRKARMGKSLENHLDFLFSGMGIHFSHGKATEGKKKPDFVFPGIKHYHSRSFPSKKLTILGAKSTCKDRWRQVLSEAKKVKRKHLITLEPSITEDQTNEMDSDGIQLVVPAGIQTSYTKSQREWLLNLKEFTELVLKNQKSLFL